MTTVEARIELDAPVGIVFDALQDPAALPILIDGVDDVRCMPESLVLVTSLHAQPWEVRLVDKADGRHITWDRIDGPGSTEIRFRPAGPGRTRLAVLVYDVDDAAGCKAVLDRQLEYLQRAIADFDRAPPTMWGVAGPW